MVITADRPPSVINTGANQTTQQDQLFGIHVRTSASLADTTGNVRAWRFEVSRVWRPPRRAYGAAFPGLCTSTCHSQNR